MKVAVQFCLFLALSAPLFGDESSALARLKKSVSSEKSVGVSKNKDGEVREIRVNAPAITNDEIALFNQFPKLERLTISHAGYGSDGKTGVDFSGVKHLATHPSLYYFSAGGALGKNYLAALPALKNVTELYVQTTHSVDADWKPVGSMTHLIYLGIRVRNDRMSKLTGAMFEQLTSLDNLERFLLSEMTFDGDSEAFVKFVTTRPKLRELALRRCSGLPESALAEIRAAKPNLKIEIKE